MPTFGSLFAGIGGFDLGLERAGWTCAWQVENDAFCARILARRWPHVACWADVREWQGDGNESPDLLVGGFPCQDLSIAGQRAGLGGERSGLFWEIVRIAKEARPTWGLFENVPGLLSSNRGRDMGLVLAGLRECWPAVGYRILDSRYFGVAQRRRRVFFVCGPDERRVAEVLFEPEGGAGDLAPSGEAGADLARCLATGTNGARYDGDTENFVVNALRSSRGGPDDNAAQEGHSSLAVRRLTPTECERLQGFPDRWSCLCEGACSCPDSPRYRTLGNAVTVTVVEWLGRRLLTALRREGKWGLCETDAPREGT